MTAVKPPFPYYGSKQTLATHIASVLPAHQHYIEPYGGSLAVLLAKWPSRQETVNDLSRDLMIFWRVLRDRSADLARRCALTPHSRAEHDAAFTPVEDGDELEIARRTWIRLTQGRSNALYCRTGWRYQVRENGLSLPGYLDAYRDRLIPAAERLAGVSLECLPALDIIARYGSDPTVAFYVDPPYVPGTRNSSHYLHEMKTEAEHRELAAALNSTAAAVILSGYSSPLYDELYQGWHRREIRMVNTQAGVASSRTEVLWSNRPFSNVTPSLFELEASA